MDLDITTINEDPSMEYLEDLLAEEYEQSLFEMSMIDVLDEYIATIDM